MILRLRMDVRSVIYWSVSNSGCRSSARNAVPAAGFLVALRAQKGVDCLDSYDRAGTEFDCLSSSGFDEPIQSRVRNS